MTKQEQKLIEDLKEFNFVNWEFFFNEEPRSNHDLAELLKTSIKQSKSILSQLENLERKFRLANEAERMKAILSYKKKELKKPKK